MNISDNDAGVGEVRPLSSRQSGTFEGSHPLQILAKNLRDARMAMALCGANSFWFGFANLAPKLALEKVTVTEVPQALLFENASGVRVMPLGSQTAYYQAIIGALDQKKTLLLVPTHIKSHLQAAYTAKLQQTEFVMGTDKLRRMGGGSLRTERHLISQARRKCELEWFTGDKLEDYLAVNQAWYRQNAKEKFRTYDKTSIDWMLQHFADLQAIAPDLCCLGVRHEGVLIAFTIASALSSNTWSAYTERFDRTAPVQGANWLCWQELAMTKFADIEFENDGTADTTALRRNKDKLVVMKTQFFTVAS